MDNQHRQIKGYRELSEADIALMNKIKDMGPLLEELVATVYSRIQEQRQACAPNYSGCIAPGDEPVGGNLVEKARLARAQPDRWAAIGRTHFQEGLMALTRAVAQPTFF